MRLFSLTGEFKHPWKERSLQRTREAGRIFDFLREQTGSDANPEGLLTPERVEIILHHPDLTKLNAELNAAIEQKPGDVTLNQFFLEKITISFRSSYFLHAPETSTQIIRLDNILENAYRAHLAWHPDLNAEKSYSQDASALVFYYLRECGAFTVKILSKLLLINMLTLRGCLDTLKNAHLLSKANIEIILIHTPMTGPRIDKCLQIADIMCQLDELHSTFPSLTISEKDQYKIFNSELIQFAFYQWCLFQPQLTQGIPELIKPLTESVHDNKYELEIDRLLQEPGDSLDEVLTFYTDLKSWYNAHSETGSAQVRQNIAEYILLFTVAIEDKKNSAREQRAMKKHDMRP